MTKRLHLGRATQLGLESALLAQRGVTGPTTVIEGPYGYLHAFSPSPRTERLLTRLGEEWLLDDLTIKAYPVHASGQAIVHAIQLHKDRAPIDAMAIERVRITTRGHAPEKRHLDPAPDSMLGAQYSLPYSVAIALTRDLSDPSVVDESVLHDGLIQRLARSVEVCSDPGYFAQAASDTSAEIRIESNGSTQTVTAGTFPGAPTQPLDFDGACDKFQRYARVASTPQRTAQLIELVRHLERLDDTAQLARLIGAPSA